MKQSAVVALLVIGTVFATALMAEEEVQIKQVPMKWRQAALVEGQDLYVELCAACHGASGKGDGPAAPGLTKAVPDLTMLAARNGGVFPEEEVEKAITGKSRNVVSHGSADMPIWGSAFEDVRPDWRMTQRKHFAKQRILNLTAYLESLQAESSE